MIDSRMRRYAAEKTVPAILTLFLLLVSQAGCSGGSEAAVTAEELSEHVGFLASDALQGRESGTAGARTAEEYIERVFIGSGLDRLPGADGYRLSFELHRPLPDPAGTFLEIRSPRAGLRSDAVITAELGSEFRPFPFAGTGEAEGRVVFAGYGITAPEFGYDDYLGLDVEGTWVLVLRHEPRENDPASVFAGIRLTDHATFLAKARNARNRGALGLLLVTDPLNHERVPEDLRLNVPLFLEEGELERYGKGPAREQTEVVPGFPAFQISERIARALIGDPTLERASTDGSAGREAAAGNGSAAGETPAPRNPPDDPGPGDVGTPAGVHTLESLQEALDGGTLPTELAVRGGTVRAGFGGFTRSETFSTANVAGFIRGYDRRLSREWIVIGAHYDHIGAFSGAGDTIYNGADDNASGTSGLLELAEAFGRSGRRPRRSIVFIAFSGEEEGLLGSRAFLDRQLGTLEREPDGRIVFMVNLDMIGRNPTRPVEVYGDGLSAGLRELVESANLSHSLPLRFHGTDYEPASDHHSFYTAGIPFLFFFTGLHSEYHGVDDEPDRIAYDRMAALISLVRDVVRGIDALEKIDPVTPRARPGRT